ncbi:MAG: glycosyltransferase family 39 protein, partial [Pseudomonadota bacterium]|nr:glycosyltransferase family 39 protein [Pseudomonadota bacterium]
MFKTFKEKFLLIWVLGIVLYLPLMNNFNAWYDEQYSLYLTSLSWQDMFHAIELEDSHPPMYYIILKLWMMGMDYHLVGWARFSNLVFLALTALLGAFPVRRLAGDKTALWFAALTFFFPASLWLGTNIRMYSLFYLEITAFITYALLILKEGKTKDWAMFLGWGMTLPYTHYYGCFTL